MTFHPLEAAALLIVLAAILGYLNHRFLKLPHTAGMAIMGAAASLIVIGIDAAVPSSSLAENLRSLIDQVDFQNTLMEGMLSFLLFAGALHVDLGRLREAKWPIAVLASVGVLASTLIVGGGFKLISNLLGFDVPLLWCLVFGALISPTDPVSVLSVLKSMAVPERLRATVGGESLFNDGVGVVVFSILLSAAVSGHGLNFVHAGEMFLVEALGGVILGLVSGWIAYRAMRSIDNYNIEVLLSLAVVMGGYALAHEIHVSGPVAMAVAGLLIGNHGVTYAMSDLTRDYLIKFWSVLDDILNSVLFLLIGLEIIAISARWGLLAAGLLCIPLVLAARAISVGPPLAIWRAHLPWKLSFSVLTWGGLRGGISIALALSLPPGPFKDLILAATYVVVMFSVVAQGSTVGPMVLKQIRATERYQEAHPAD